MQNLKVVTHNFPSIVRDPIIALIGQECYTSLIWNVDLSDTQCIKYSISKGLGLGIVAGGAIVKVPQILKIVGSKSARGLSLSSYVLDTAGLAITVAYNYRHEFPWSTYGENVFLLVQNVVITFLIITFSTPTRPLLLLLTSLALLTSLPLLLSLPLPTLKFLAAATIPLSLLSKLPQISSNYSARSTGQLSAFLVFNSLAGCAARVFTTATETGDAVLWWGFVLAAGLNAVLALQMALYWGEKEGKGAGGHKVEKRESGEEVRIAVEDKSPPRSPGVGTTTNKSRPTSPVAGTPTPKRYVRKLD